jgi:hypothetical protein
MYALHEGEQPPAAMSGSLVTVIVRVDGARPLVEVDGFALTVIDVVPNVEPGRTKSVPVAESTLTLATPGSDETALRTGAPGRVEPICVPAASATWTSSFCAIVPPVTKPLTWLPRIPVLSEALTVIVPGLASSTAFKLFGTPPTIVALTVCCESKSPVAPVEANSDIFSASEPAGTIAAIVHV